MKKIYLFLIALLLTVSASAQTTIKGDVNGDKEEPDARAIDLGLSVKWASCNVGATAPEEYGGYYSWGETEEKREYSWDAYKYCNGNLGLMTKYCTSGYDGTGEFLSFRNGVRRLKGPKATLCEGSL